MPTEKLSRNEQLLRDAPNRGIISELWLFLITSKKWWMLPIFIVLLFFGLLIVLAKTAAAPFIYTLF